MVGWWAGSMTGCWGVHSSSGVLGYLVDVGLLEVLKAGNRCVEGGQGLV